jgi:hypothetical protein
MAGLSLSSALTLGLAPRGGGATSPSLQITASSILESALSGSTVGVLSVVGGSGTYTFTKTADPDAKFAVSGSNLNTAAALDYETAQSHSVTISASNGVDAPVVRTFTISVTNVFEAASLSALTLPGSITTGATVAITGATAGSTITGTLPAGWSVNSGARTVTVGAVATGQAWTLVETLADSANSPRTSTGTSDVVAGGGTVTQLASNTSGRSSGGTWTSVGYDIPLPTGTGVAVPLSSTYWNESGADITTVSAILTGWVHTNSGSAGFVDLPTYSRTVNLSYLNQSVDLTISASTTLSITGGATVETDRMVLAVPIPAGCAVVVTATATPGSGAAYHPVMHGFAGLMTTADSSTIREPIGLGGDSLVETEVKWFPLEVVGERRAPIANFAIGGSTIRTWAVGARFDKQAAVLAQMGVKNFISEWSINDTTAGTSAAQTQTDHHFIEAKLSPYGIDYFPTTQSARGSVANVTAVSVTASTDTLAVVVPNASIYTVNTVIQVLGATGTGAATVNGMKLIEAIDTGTNTLTLAFLNTTPISGAVTGTITLSDKDVPMTTAHQAPIAVREAIRGPLNGLIRSDTWTGGFIEVGDRTESSRDSGKPAVGGTQPELRAPIPFVLGAGSNASTINVPEATVAVRMDDTPTGNSYVAITSGAARGAVSSLTNNFTDLQALSAGLAATPAPGDSAVFIPRSNYSTLVDQIHPDGFSGDGENVGSSILVNVLRDAVVSQMGMTGFGLPDTAGTLFSDNFGRPEESLSANANWTLVNGQARYIRVFRNRLFSAWSSSTSTRAVVRSPDMGSADHWTELVYGGAGGNANNMAALRLTDAQNFIGLHWATNGLTITILKRVTGTNTTLATFTLATALKRGDRIKYGIKGSDITLWVNGFALTPTTGGLTGLASLPASISRQGVVVGGNRTEICSRYATGLMP